MVDKVPSVPKVQSIQPPAQQQQQPVKQQVNKPVYTTPQLTQKGNLVTFQYLNYKHDSNPLLLVSGIDPAGMIKGINLHYLTFPNIKRLIETYCNRTFSYEMVKGDLIVKKSFRKYKSVMIRNMRVVDCSFLLGIMGVARSYSPTEMEAMRLDVENQIREYLNG